MNRNELIASGAIALLALLFWVAPRFIEGGGFTQGGVHYNAAGIAIGGVEPNPSGGVPLNIDNIVRSADRAVVISRDGADTFTVPTPDDPEWEDYLEMRRHFRSSMDNSPGFVIAYDPEWRTAVRGVRPAADPGFELFGGRASIGELVEEVVLETAVRNQQGMIDLAVRKEEFEIVCWPSFPQSRPFMRVPWEEAWGFQYANLLGGSREGMRQVAERELEVLDVSVGSVMDYNGIFRLHNQVRIRALDPGTRETVVLDYLDSIIERNGEFKVFLYKD
jgi:hypothetical protein